VRTVEQHLEATLGAAVGRASVTFLGTETYEVLRFDGDDVVRYVTVGMSRHPMADPAAVVVDPVAGPRAELVLTLRSPRDSVARRLAVLGASPAVEGVVVRPGSSLDVGEPLWDGGSVTAVLVAEPGGVVPDLPLDAPSDPVRFLPVLPMTPTEAAWKRVHGPEALEELWLRSGTDLRDPQRGAVRLP
jgi:hypothetical protein